MSDLGNIGRDSKGRFDYGHAFTLKLPYEYKLIRDAVKSAIYSTAAGLAMTKEEAYAYYTREGATLLDSIFADAISKKQYDIIEKFFDRIMGKPSIQLNVSEKNDSMIDELTDKQKRAALEAASKTIEKKK